MESEAFASLTLTGADLDPALVTRETVIQPSKAWLAGQLIQPGAALRYEENGWSVRSDLPLSSPLAAHVASLLERLRPGWEALRILAQQHRAELACVLYSYGGDRPEIHFDLQVLSALHELHAEIDVDLYILPARKGGRPGRRIAG